MGDPVIKSLNRIVLDDLCLGAGSMNIITTSSMIHHLCSKSVNIIIMK